MKNLRIRNKYKPSKTNFEYEIELVDIMNYGTISPYKWKFASESQLNTYKDVMRFLETLKITTNTYKIIKKPGAGAFSLKIKVLVENESDVIILSLAGSHLMKRIYRYVTQLSEHPTHPLEEE